LQAETIILERPPCRKWFADRLHSSPPELFLRQINYRLVSRGGDVGRDDILLLGEVFPFMPDFVFFNIDVISAYTTDQITTTVVHELGHIVAGYKGGPAGREAEKACFGTSWAVSN
jgi:hypothetical protein